MRKRLRIACFTCLEILAVAVILMPLPRTNAAPPVVEAKPVIVPKVAVQAADKAAVADVERRDAAWIGLMFDEVKASGLVVSNVFPGGPAAFAGIRVGDAVEKIGDAKTTTAAEATAAIEQLSPRQPATLTVRRGEKTLDLKINVGSRNEFQEHYHREMSKRDPRDPNFAKHHGVSEADMHVELVRRLFEQNQRLETKLNLVLDEVQTLRSELRESRKAK